MFSAEWKLTDNRPSGHYFCWKVTP